MDITSLDKCTGCTACFSVCSQNAIYMKMNSEGFLYPEVNKEKCINCGKCKAICPINTTKMHEGKKILNCYAAYTLDDKIRKKSSSGGLFYTLALKMIAQSGVVISAEFNSGFQLKHGIAQSKEEIYNMMGSKYLQSDMGGIYRETKRILKKNNVLFCGTPCQIAGLKKYLGCEYENLITVDLICHGVPSPMVFQKYLDEFNGKVKRVSFRNKNKGWKKYYVEVETESERYLKKHSRDSYMRLFLKDIILRKSCYKCRFKESSADITIGDFWNIEKILPEQNNDKGVSAVIINSKKGQRYFMDISSELDITSVKYVDILKYNPSLKNSPDIPKDRQKLFENIKNKKIKELDKLYANEKIFLRIKRRLGYLLKSGD